MEARRLCVIALAGAILAGCGTAASQGYQSSGQRQAYNAGWNEIALRTTESTYYTGTCEVIYPYDGHLWKKAPWLAGCHAATTALRQAQQGGGPSATIPVK